MNEKNGLQRKKRESGYSNRRKEIKKYMEQGNENPLTERNIKGVIQREIRKGLIEREKNEADVIEIEENT